MLERVAALFMKRVAGARDDNLAHHGRGRQHPGGGAAGGVDGGDYGRADRLVGRRSVAPMGHHHGAVLLLVFLRHVALRAREAT